MSDFTPRLEILPPAQRRLWEMLHALPSMFVLYGGTAIALRLGHRQSIDFDFFARQPIDPRALISEPVLAGAMVTQIAPNTVSVTIDRGGIVRLSFFGVPGLPELAAPDRADGVRIASVLDLAGTTAAVVQVRAEAKDYIDIDALLSSGKIDLPSMLDAGKALYGDGFDAISTLKALTYYDDGDLPKVPEAVRQRLAAAVRTLDRQ